jgi:hypothetical protein
MKKIHISFNKLNIQYVVLAVFFIISLVGIFNTQRKANIKKQEIYEQLESSRSAQPDNSLEHYQKLLDEKNPMTCVFRTELPGALITGTIFMDPINNLVRTDLDAPDKQGKQKLSHTIYDKDNIYLWYEGDDTGMHLNKTTYTSKIAELTEKLGEDAVNSSLSYFGVLANISMYEFIDQPDIKCEVWAIDNFKFVLPPRVKFVDAVGFSEGLDKIICNECDKEATEASRLLCRQTLKCK